MCRKRLQRTKSLVERLEQEVERDAHRIETTAEEAMERIAVRVVPTYATQSGFVGDDAQTTVPVAAPAVPAAGPIMANGPGIITPPGFQASPWEATPAPRTEAMLQSEPQAPIVTLPTVIPAGSTTPEPRADFEPFANLKKHRMNRTRWVAVATVLLVMFAGLPFLLWPKSSPTPNLTSSNITEIKIGGQSLHLNVNTFIDQGKEFRTTGPVTFQNQTNSTSAFAIQTAAGNDLLIADTTNQKIGINTVPTANGADLQVAGDIQTNGALLASGGSTSLSNSGLVINNTLICTAAGCSILAAQAASGQVFTGNANTLNNQLGSFYLNSSNQNAGTLSDSRLSGNVALLNGTGPQAFSGNNRFNGTFLAQNAANSATTFQIQNAAGTSNLLVADSVSTRIGIGTAAPAYTLDVAGDINSATGIRVNGALLCNAGGCTASGGSNNYVQNATALQTANFNIQSAATGSVTATIRAATSQTADLLQLKDQAGVNLLTVGPTGNTLIRPSTDSINAFSVQNALGTSLLISGDTLNARVAIATAVPPNYTLDVGGDINSATGLRVAGNLVCSTTCTPGGGSGNYIQNGTAVQTANFAIQSDLNSHIAAYIRGASGQSADLLDVIGKGAGDVNLPIATFGASGAVLFQNAINSTTALQIQNVAGNNYLLVNTSGASVSLGDTGIASTIQIGNTTGAVAQTVNIGNNATASSATTVVLGSTIGTSPLTLQAGSTGATLKSTSTTAFVIQKADGTGTLLTADTSNTRIGIGGLAANGVLTIGTNTTAASGGLYFGTDTNLYRSAAGVLTLANSSGGVSLKAQGPSGTSGRPGISITRSDGVYLGSLAATADSLLGIEGTNFKISTSLVFASSFDATADTNLYRANAGVLKTDGNLYAAGDLVAQQNLTNQTAMGSQGPSGQAGITFGSARDTNLYRSGAGILTTDNHLHVNGDLYSNYGLSSQIAMGGLSAMPVIYFGNALDTYLYRSAATILTTNSSVQAASFYSSSSSTAVSATGVYYIPNTNCISGKLTAWMDPISNGDWESSADFVKSSTSVLRPFVSNIIKYQYSSNNIMADLLPDQGANSYGFFSSSNLAEVNVTALGSATTLRWKILCSD